MKDLIKLLYNTGNDLRCGSNKPHTVGQSSTATYTLMQTITFHKHVSSRLRVLKQPELPGRGVTQRSTFAGTTCPTAVSPMEERWQTALWVTDA